MFVVPWSQVLSFKFSLRWQLKRSSTVLRQDPTGTAQAYQKWFLVLPCLTPGQQKKVNSNLSDLLLAILTVLGSHSTEDVWIKRSKHECFINCVKNLVLKKQSLLFICDELLQTGSFTDVCLHKEWSKIKVPSKFSSLCARKTWRGVCLSTLLWHSDLQSAASSW